MGRFALRFITRRDVEIFVEADFETLPEERPQPHPLSQTGLRIDGTIQRTVAPREARRSRPLRKWLVSLP